MRVIYLAMFMLVIASCTPTEKYPKTIINVHPDGTSTIVQKTSNKDSTSVEVDKDGLLIQNSSK